VENRIFRKFLKDPLIFFKKNLVFEKENIFEIFNISENTIISSYAAKGSSTVCSAVNYPPFSPFVMCFNLLALCFKVETTFTSHANHHGFPI
jgi:hypothetical protein